MIAFEVKPGGMYEQRDGRAVVVSRRPDVDADSKYPLICSLGIIRDRFGRAFQSPSGQHDTDIVKCIDDASRREGSLEVRPGKYRTRDGRVADVRADKWYTGHFVGEAGDAKHLTWDSDGRRERGFQSSLDLIERIEDEKAKECTVKFRKYEYLTSFDRTITKPEGTIGLVPVVGKVLWESGPLRLASAPRQHVSDAAWEAIEKRDGKSGAIVVTREYVEELTRQRGCMYRTVEEIDDLERRANAQINEKSTASCHEARMWAESELDAARAKIARLEAENESLSRQLRSREINKEPTSTGKRWRWSPMV